MSNLIDFIYLNPRLHVDNNLYTLEDTSNYYYSNDSNNYLDGNVPEVFNEFVYLANVGNTPSGNQLGDLNNVIFASMLLDGYDNSDIKQNGSFVTTINRPIYLASPNTFSTGSNNFDLSTYGISLSDKLYILKDTSEKLYLDIDTIINDNIFSVLHSAQLTNMASAYRLMGTLIYDPTRLATITYLLNSNDTPIITMDSDFNPELYKLLYPTSRLYTDESAYTDFLTNNSSLIGRTYELGASLSSNGQFESVTIHNVLMLDFQSLGGYLKWDNIRIDGISQDDFTKSININPINNYIITEKAIKKYTDDNILSSTINLSNYMMNLNSNFASNNSYVLDIYGNNRLHDYIEIGNSKTTIDSCGTLNTENIIIDGQIFYIKGSLSNVALTFSQFDSTMTLSKSKSYALHNGAYIMIKYSGYKNILMIESTSFTDNEMILKCVSQSSQINLPFEEIYSDILIVEKNKTVEKIIKEPIDLVEINGLYDVDTTLYTLDQNKYLVFTDNWIISNSLDCHLLSNVSSNSYMCISGLVENSSNLIIHNTKPIKTTISVYSYRFEAPLFAVIGVVIGQDPYNTYRTFMDQKYMYLNGKIWMIQDILNVDSTTGTMEIKIRTLDRTVISYDSVLFGYLSVNQTDLFISNFDILLFKFENENENDMHVVEKAILINNQNSNAYISYVDDTIDINNYIVCSRSNIFIPSELSVLRNGISIKNYGDGVSLENNSLAGVLYLGSSNAFVDNFGNLQLNGQVIAPEFSQLTSSNNVVHDLQKRVAVLEDIISKYNLYL